jgi:putative acetyltransferase
MKRFLRLIHHREPIESSSEAIMKIQKATIEHRPKVYALLQRAFPGSDYEAGLVQKLHENGRTVHEWVCIHVNKAIAYIAFSNAYHGKDICGLHLAPMAVAPDFQQQGVGSELLRFALRQEEIKGQPLFVLGEPGYYQRFGFEPCSLPICPFDTGNAHFLSMRNTVTTSFTVGYEPEFHVTAIPPGPPGKKRRKR